MFADIRQFAALEVPHFTQLAVQISGQPSEDVGHLTPGLNYVDANITGAAYDKFASPFLFA